MQLCRDTASSLSFGGTCCFPHRDERSLAGHTSQSSGVYPGWDRFGRVILHSWVDGAPDNVSGALLDRPRLARVEHPTAMMKQQLGYRRVRLRGRTGTSSTSP